MSKQVLFCDFFSTIHPASQPAQASERRLENVILAPREVELFPDQPA